MSTRAFLPLLCLTLAACQSQNPYTDESAPIPPAPPVEQIQAPTYPAAPRDFSSYQHWSWRSPPAGTASISGEELQEMVAGALDQRGLRPAPGNAPGDVRISASASKETRVRQTYDNYGYGPHVGVGRYGGGYGTGGKRGHRRDGRFAAQDGQTADGEGRSGDGGDYSSVRGFDAVAGGGGGAAPA